ncbi:MAG: HAMP domain-containing histidine kinase, partial [Cytophagaceae bacterium]|jgi:hypothetical protein|nr:HAMP domain-containing histidine kinase [Cytophagaceae bacterium]
LIKEGKFIVNKQSYKNYEVYSLLALERDYPVENKYLKSSVNPTLFRSVPVIIKDFSNADTDFSISETLPLLYFSFIHPQQLFLLDDLITIVYVLTVVLLFWIWKKSKWALSTWKLLTIKIVGYLCLRIIIYCFPAESMGSQSFLFSPSYFASSIWTGSLFDFIVTIVIISSTINEIVSNRNVKEFIVITLGNRFKGSEIFIFLLLIILLFSVFHLYYSILTSVILNSSSPINFIDHWVWDIPQFFTIIMVLMLSWSFFFTIHPIYRIIVRLIERKRIQFSWFIFPLIIISILYFVIENQEGRLLFIAFVFYSVLILLAKFPLELVEMRYASFLYLFTFSIVSSFIISIGLYFKGTNRLNQQKKKFAQNILYERDEITEFLLYDVSKGIRKDALIREKFSMPLTDWSMIENKVNRYYITNYFVDYSIRILLFNSSGSLVNQGENYLDFNLYLDDVVYASKYIRERDIYIYSDKISGIRKYISINKIKNYDRPVGYVVVELTSTKYNKNRVFPELATDSRYIKDEGLYFDYAIIRDNQVESTNGLFNYNENFIKTFSSKKISFSYDFKWKDYHHYVVKNDASSWLVISSPYAMAELLLTESSIYFSLHILVILLFILFYMIRLKQNKIAIGFATKIQLYVNLAYFVPLVIVSLVTLGFVNRNNEVTIEDTFLQVSEKLSSIISTQASTDGNLKEEKITGLLENSDLIKIQGYDINIFSTHGSLISTNHPEVFKRSIITERINPEAIHQLIEKNNQYIVLNERIGKLQFKSVYRWIRSSLDATPVGIIHMPFFESKEASLKQVIQFLKIIVNIFALSFIFLLILSYIVSVYLTYPLQLITQGIRKTGLEDNEPILWESNDEIGRLVQEYNYMLLKIEESKKQLSISEKESAWREMARQVAHEIKNPLTPMKLKIQYMLQRLRSDNAPMTLSEKEESYKSLITHIDTLSDIAGSFSSFYKLPELQLEDVDFKQTVTNVIDLHNNDQAQFLVLGNELNYRVWADAKMLNNIVNNLVLNALQSMPNQRNAILKFYFNTTEDTVIVELKDNGSGIPIEIQDKIFRPYFSTKYTGSGIGLALAKRLIEDMGGKIWFTTIEGEGTSFFIQLPRCEK